MKTLHSKSLCCGAKVYRFGGRRRQCAKCHKTWRIRAKKRGRKLVRVHPNIKQTVITRRESLRQWADRGGKGREVVRRRHRRNLEALLKRLPKMRAPNGPLIAVIDGWCIYPKGQRHIVYLILLRPVKGKYATIMEPVILPGWEGKQRWEKVLRSLPPDVLKRIKALVVDGITGVECLANDWGWVVQRCHFHQIAMVQTLRGNRWGTVKQKPLREQIYQNVLNMLRTPDEIEAQELYRQTKRLIKLPNCPRWIRLRVGGCIRRLDYFRSYRKYPELNLSTTTNSAECVFQKVTEMSRLTRGFRTIESFKLWLNVQLRNMKYVRCNGKIFNQNSMS